MWAANEELIAEAGRRLAEAAPDSQVILFGPHALEEASPHDEVGFLVIEPKVEREVRGGIVHAALSHGRVLVG